MKPKYLFKPSVKKLELSPPCDLQKVCDLLEIEVSFISIPDDLRGIYYQLPDGAKIIKLNDRLPETRLRNVWAHEIGHAMDPCGSLGEILIREGEITWGKEAPKAAERRADRFAVQLLMPELYLRRECERLGHPATNRTGTLAELFGVEISVMRSRLRQLGLVNSRLKRKNPELG